MLTRTAAMRALEQVEDPELGVDIVSLGLIYAVTVEGEAVLVRMTMTSPFCPLEDHFRKAVADTLRRLPGITTVNIDFVFDPPWSPARMKQGVRAQLGLPGAGGAGRARARRP